MGVSTENPLPLFILTSPQPAGEGVRGVEVNSMGFEISVAWPLHVINFSGPVSSLQKMATFKNYHLPQKGCDEP